jgi:hypothetical protein
MTTTQTDNTGEPLSPELIALTRKSLAQLYAATQHAESLVDSVLSLPLVQVAIEHVHLAADARPDRSPRAAAEAAALELLTLPPEQWSAVLAALAPRQQKAALQHVLAAARPFARTEPDRAHRLAGSILRVIRNDRLPPRAPLLRRQLAGHALLLRARALMTLHACADALRVVTEAHAAFPRGDAYAHDRIQAQLLRGQLLGATGHAADALQTLTACAQFAVVHIDPCALVDALAAAAVLLCSHREYAVAHSALALAAHVAGRPGNEASLPPLYASRAECAFLGYPDAL